MSTPNCKHASSRYTLSRAEPGQADGTDELGRPYRDFPMTPREVASYVAAIGSTFFDQVAEITCRRCGVTFDADGSPGHTRAKENVMTTVKLTPKEHAAIKEFVDEWREGGHVLGDPPIAGDDVVAVLERVLASSPAPAKDPVPIVELTDDGIRRLRELGWIGEDLLRSALPDASNDYAGEIGSAAARERCAAIVRAQLAIRACRTCGEQPDLSGRLEHAESCDIADVEQVDLTLDADEIAPYQNADEFDLKRPRTNRAADASPGQGWVRDGDHAWIQRRDDHRLAIYKATPGWGFVWQRRDFTIAESGARFPTLKACVAAVWSKVFDLTDAYLNAMRDQAIAAQRGAKR